MMSLGIGLTPVAIIFLIRFCRLCDCLAEKSLSHLFPHPFWASVPKKLIGFEVKTNIAIYPCKSGYPAHCLVPQEVSNWHYLRRDFWGLTWGTYPSQPSTSWILFLPYLLFYVALKLFWTSFWSSYPPAVQQLTVDFIYEIIYQKTKYSFHLLQWVHPGLISPLCLVPLIHRLGAIINTNQLNKHCHVPLS